MANILKGVPVAKKINVETEEIIKQLMDADVFPKLAIVRVGEKDDDVYYENAAVKRCAAMGVLTETVHLPADVQQEKVESEIIRLNEDNSVHGVLILRPLPAHIDDKRISSLLSPDKDIDGITPFSLYGVFSGSGDGFIPCTARACMEILSYYGVGLSGKNAAVIGRSLVIGRPIAMLLMSNNATVTICHTRTRNVNEITKNADIIVTSAGKAGSLTADFVKAGQTVIDVSMNMAVDGSMCGDADYSAVSGIVENITPVPGGVGSVTTAILINNTVNAALKKTNI